MDDEIQMAEYKNTFGLTRHDKLFIYGLSRSEVDAVFKELSGKNKEIAGHSIGKAVPATRGRKPILEPHLSFVKSLIDEGRHISVLEIAARLRERGVSFSNSSAVDALIRRYGLGTDKVSTGLGQATRVQNPPSPNSPNPTSSGQASLGRDWSSRAKQNSVNVEPAGVRASGAWPHAKDSKGPIGQCGLVHQAPSNPTPSRPISLEWYVYFVRGVARDNPRYSVDDIASRIRDETGNQMNEATVENLMMRAGVPRPQPLRQATASHP